MERFDLLLKNFNILTKELETIKEQLRSENENFFNTIVENSTNFIAIVQNGKYVFVNSYGLELLKCRNSSDIIGKDVNLTIHPDYQKLVSERFSKVEIESKRPIQLKLMALDGTIFDTESNSVPFQYKNEPAVLIIGRDVSVDLEHKKAIQKEEQLRTDILNSFEEVIAFYEPNHKIKWINNAGKKQLGFTDESYIGKYCYKVWFNSNEPCNHCPVVTKKVVSSERLVNFVDQTIWLIRHIPMFDDAQNTIGFIELRENVTEKEKTKQELDKSRTRLINAEIAASIGHFEFDLTKKEEIWSQGAFHILGLPYKQTPLNSDEQFTKFIHSEDVDRVLFH
jgi:PAS domain S-box-containing protein